MFCMDNITTVVSSMLENSTAAIWSWKIKDAFLSQKLILNHPFKCVRTPWHL